MNQKNILNISRQEMQFVELYCAGLWNFTPDKSLFEGEVDWEAIYDMALAQTVIAVVAEGIGLLPVDLRPVNFMHKFLPMVMKIEKENDQMNQFIPSIMTKLGEIGCETLLLKGQGVACNYINPLRRISGDIDLYVPNSEEYLRGREFLLKYAREVSEEDKSRSHSIFYLNGFVVELHGDFSVSINHRSEIHKDQWKDSRLLDDVRLIKTKYGEMKVPSYNFDAVFIFAHMVSHFFGGGVGLRQVSDWMRFFYVNSSYIDHEKLYSDLNLLGLYHVWTKFASLAVDVLKCPLDKMPFYDKKYHKDGVRIFRNIIYTGNFGFMQKKNQLSNNSNRQLKKFVTMLGQFPVYMKNFSLFPKESIYCFIHFIKTGIKSAI